MTIVHNVCMKELQHWKKTSFSGCDIWSSGYLINEEWETVFDKAALLTREFHEAHSEFINWSHKLRGHFAFVVEVKNRIFAIVDHTRSIPLFYTEVEGQSVVSNEALSLKEQCLGGSEVNVDSALSIAMSGYSIGNATLYKNLFVFYPGESIFLETGKPCKKEIQPAYKPWEIDETFYPDPVNALKEVTLEILESMVHSLGGRQVVIPLSAGMDSRLIASGLKELGYENVLCFSYGMEGNFESEVSKKIAQKLGYHWRFIPLHLRKEKAFYKSKIFVDYLQFADTLDAVSNFQGLSTVFYLKQLKLLDKDAIFINGLSGDFITGGHVTAYNKVLQNGLGEPLANTIEKLILEKHYNLWGELLNQPNSERIFQSLIKEAAKHSCQIEEPLTAHGFLEFLEFVHRQSKYVVAGQRAYEFFGYEWRLPLWDVEYLKFWQKIPLHLKANQKLFKDMLFRENWGNVWTKEDFPVNNKYLRPRWILPVRGFLKLPFGLLGQKGKQSWHLFDRLVFMYIYDITRMSCSIDYLRMLKDYRRKPRHTISWVAEDYIKNKCLDSRYFS
jgi:asparagine synthase (glutamine-hydrolysing)